MGELEITNKLKGDLGELYFEHYCQQHKYAYLKLEEIYNTFTPKRVLCFRFGWERVHVPIPHEISEELTTVCQPKNNTNSPAFVFDYLTVSLHNFEYDKTKQEWRTREGFTPGPNSFNWVEVKWGNAWLSEWQKGMRKKVKLNFWEFHINSDPPPKIKITTQ